jgi:hypothetical protein
MDTICRRVASEPISTGDRGSPPTQPGRWIDCWRWRDALGQVDGDRQKEGEEDRAFADIAQTAAESPVEARPNPSLQPN